MGEGAIDCDDVVGSLSVRRAEVSFLKFDVFSVSWTRNDTKDAEGVGEGAGKGGALSYIGGNVWEAAGLLAIVESVRAVGRWIIVEPPVIETSQQCLLKQNGRKTEEEKE